MNIKNLWEQFETEYLFVGEPRLQNSKYHDKQLNRIDCITAFSIFVNYHSDRCIHILKDTHLTSYFWRDLVKRYDLKNLYINKGKLHLLF